VSDKTFYKLTSSRGAILVLADKYATSFEVGKWSEEKFIQYILLNLETIAERCKCDVHELVAVTGCILTGDWDAAIVIQGYNHAGTVPTIHGLTHDVSLEIATGQNLYKQASDRDREWESKNQCIFIRSHQFKKHARFKPKAVPMFPSSKTHHETWFQTTQGNDPEASGSQPGFRGMDWKVDNEPEEPETHMQVGLKQSVRQEERGNAQVCFHLLECNWLNQDVQRAPRLFQELLDHLRVWKCKHRFG
jgi:hypothetical protein